MKRTLIQNMPAQYDAEDVEEVLRTAIRQIDERMAQLESGKARGGNPSSSSTTARPASVASSPTPHVTMRLAHDSTRDRWHTATVGGVAYVGPGRMWRVRSHNVTGIFTGGGPASYRLTYDNLQFGVISCRLMDELASGVALNGASQTGSRWEVTYGILITGIPAFPSMGLPTRATVVSGKHSPAAQSALNDSGTTTWLSGNRSFFEPRVGTDFSSSDQHVFTEWQAGAPASGWMLPTTVTTEYLDQIEGISAMVVTADNALQTCAQLNGLDSANLSYIGGRGRGLVAPSSDEPTSPCPGGVAAVNSAADLIARTTGTLAAGDKVVEGCPFLYEDCAVAAYRPASFSVVLTLDPPRILEWSDIAGASGLFGAPTDDMRPAMWHTAGVQLTPGVGREAQLDLIVE